MNKLKRLLTLLVSICLIFSLAGCFNSEADRKKIVEPIVTQSIHTMCDILKQFDNMRQIPNNTNQETFLRKLEKMESDLLAYKKRIEGIQISKDLTDEDKKDIQNIRDTEVEIINKSLSVTDTLKQAVRYNNATLLHGNQLNEVGNQIGMLMGKLKDSHQRLGARYKIDIKKITNDYCAKIGIKL